MYQMKPLSEYWRLMRFDKPIGILLLWFPTAWALWLANHGRPSWSLLCYFLFGTVVMRAAGCVINDLADRHIDKHVERTRLRPLTSGRLSVHEALGVLFILLSVALSIVIQLPQACFYEAVIALAITVIYPLCKRFLNGPQLVLGIAFSMGIPMAYTASNQSFDGQMVVLWVINFLWIVAYDTIYAMMDRDDDLRIGVRSTAVLFGIYCRKIILCLHIVMHGLWLIIIHWFSQTPSLFYLGWMIAGLNLLYQHHQLAQHTRSAYMSAFVSNAWYGAWMWLALLKAV